MAYFDAASAEPLHPSAREALLAALDDGWADPARLHREGRRARLLLDQAREAVAAELGCRPDELSFTTSGTQAVHLAVLGAVQARQSAARGPGHLVASAVEHSAVLNAADWLARVTGTGVTLTGVDSLGRADMAEFTAAMQRDRTLLACLQSANHEVGTAPAGRGGGGGVRELPRSPAGGRGCLRRTDAGPGRLVAADRQRPQVGRSGRRRRARRPQGHPLARAVPGR